MGLCMSPWVLAKLPRDQVNIVTALCLVWRLALGKRQARELAELVMKLLDRPSQIALVWMGQIAVDTARPEEEHTRCQDSGQWGHYRALGIMMMTRGQARRAIVRGCV